MAKKKATKSLGKLDRLPENAHIAGAGQVETSGSSPRSAKSLITVFALIINIAAGIPLPDTSATRNAIVESLSI